MKREVTTQESLTELAAAKLKLETMQQLLVLKEQLLSSKDEQINFVSVKPSGEKSDFLSYNYAVDYLNQQEFCGRER